MVRVLFFGRLRERVGIAVKDYDLPRDITALPDFVSWLEHQLGLDGALSHRTVKIVLNGIIQPCQGKLCDGDEIAFLPPVSGG